MENRKKETAGIILRAVVAMILFVIAIVNYDKLSGLDVESLLAQFNETGVIVAVVLALYFVKGLIFVLPASVIYVAVGVILDTWLAIGVNVLGIVIEILAAYFLGRFLGKDYVHRLLSKKEAGRKILATNFQDKKWLIFVTRLLPVFPIDFLSLFFGATRSNGFMHFILSVAGLAPRVILFTVIGDNLFKWIPMDKLIFIIICCIPVGVAVYLVKKLVLDKKKRKEN
ncbi:MAG: VTT domain-containing protein [Clostridia bacterium]|nr:VTT domain-containing protein [Clostridia bacterium]